MAPRGGGKRLREASHLIENHACHRFLPPHPRFFVLPKNKQKNPPRKKERFEHQLSPASQTFTRFHSEPIRAFSCLGTRMMISAHDQSVGRPDEKRSAPWEGKRTDTSRSPFSVSSALFWGITATTKVQRLDGTNLIIPGPCFQIFGRERGKRLFRSRCFCRLIPC